MNKLKKSREWQKYIKILISVYTLMYPSVHLTNMLHSYRGLYIVLVMGERAINNTISAFKEFVVKYLKGQ